MEDYVKSEYCVIQKYIPVSKKAKKKKILLCKL